MSRYFVSAGWPYLYDIPGLHNCVPMLFADVHARFLRSGGHEVYFLCGADEHGSRVEFVARGCGKDPRTLVDEKYASTLPLLAAMGLGFDTFGRTTDPRHSQFVQVFLGHLETQGKIARRSVKVAYCARCCKFLPDRFITGRCPFCHDVTYGGQCNNKGACGKIIESLDGGACALCGGPYELREREHLVMDLAPYRAAVLPNVVSDRHSREEVRRRVRQGFDDMQAVMLTRDTAWGIRTPESGDAEQSVYSWVDSLLGKVSHLAMLGPDAERKYWLDSSTRRLFFLGMDGAVFYGVLLPSLLLAADRGYSVSNWTILPNEVLIYEGGVCSKSSGTGIWLEEALAVLEGDLWRFYVFYNYATSVKDADFRWDKLAESVNRCLVDGLERNVDSVLSNDRSNSPDWPRVERVRALLSGFEVREAFRRLLDLVVDPGVSRSTLLESMPLLGCFVPRIAARARRKLQAEMPAGTSVVGRGRLDAAELRRQYQALVDERRNRQTLVEEITNLRADALCVCPIDLKEQ